MKKNNLKDDTMNEVNYKEFINSLYILEIQKYVHLKFL